VGTNDWPHRYASLLSRDPQAANYTQLISAKSMSFDDSRTPTAHSARSTFGGHNTEIKESYDMRPLPFVLAAAVATTVILAPGLVNFGSALTAGVAEAQSAPNACGLSQVAFCDTFDAPYTGASRTGQLDPSRWSVSRLTSSVQPGLKYNQFIPSPAMHCKDPITGVVPPNDYFMCGIEVGESEHVMEAFNDGGEYTWNDAHIRQPFNFANRTGTVAFEVDAKTGGPHSWWVELWITDQPLSAPHSEHPGSLAAPQNGIGLAFDTTCGAPAPAGDAGASMGSLGSIYLYHNYVVTALNTSQVPSANGTTLQGVGCYDAMPDMRNHFRVLMNQNHLEVWATDAMGTVSKKIAILDGMNLPFTTGYVHLEHVQYNANKFDGFTSYQTYHWDNVGFDGPTMPIAAQYSIPDALTAGDQPGAVNLGYLVTPGGLQNGPLNLQNVHLAGATGATLTFNTWFATGQSINYRLNGQTWHTWTGSTAAGGSSWKAASVAVNVTELINGTNTVDFSSPVGDTNVIANVDLLVPGTTGTSTGTGGNNPAPTATTGSIATSTPIPTAMATNTARPTNTAVPIITPPNTPVPPSPISNTASYSSKVGASPLVALRGGSEQLKISVKTSTATTALIDVEVYRPDGTRAFQQWQDNEEFTAGQTRTFTVNWNIPLHAAAGTYTVLVGVFEPNWAGTYDVNHNAAQIVLP
jgi:hypothetical protein